MTDMEWQPIETQPDQGEYLIFMPRALDSKMMVCCARQGANSILRTAGGLFLWDHEDKPTHWMPLPGPPA